MKKKSFHSNLFNKTINQDSIDYNPIVKAELLFRIKELERENCSCFECTDNLEKFRKYYDKINPPKEKLSL